MGERLRRPRLALRSYIMLDATVGALGFYVLGYGFAYGDRYECAAPPRGVWAGACGTPHVQAPHLAHNRRRALTRATHSSDGNNKGNGFIGSQYFALSRACLQPRRTRLHAPAQLTRRTSSPQACLTPRARPSSTTGALLRGRRRHAQARPEASLTKTLLPPLVAQVFPVHLRGHGQHQCFRLRH